MSMSNPTILVVDDEAAQRELIRAILDREAFAVLEAPDFDEALDIQQQHLGEIDLLLIDLSLPGGNGYDLSKALLAVEPRLKVLMVSGHAGAEICKFFEISTTDLHFLQKPFQPQELLDHVRAIMESADPLAGTAAAT
jgi:DNA-binding response OmpR family regulator